MSPPALEVGRRFSDPIRIESGWEDLKEKEARWEKLCHIVQENYTQNWTFYLAKNEQALVPMGELIAQSRVAIDELIDVLGRALGEAVL